MLIHGKCHCGNISFSLTWEPDPAEIPVRACTCSFCIKHGGVWASNPGGALEVVVKEPSLVSKYAFGTRTAEFHICARCGIVPVVTKSNRRPSLRGSQRQRVRRRRSIAPSSCVNELRWRRDGESPRAKEAQLDSQCQIHRNDRPGRQAGVTSQVRTDAYSYRTSSISYLRTPPGVCTSTSSPAYFPIKALAMGELIETLPFLMSASSSPTIW